MNIYNLLSILSIITIFGINTAYAFDIKLASKNKLSKKIKNDSNTAKNENYFMILVNNASGKDGKNNKREEAEQHINGIIDEITTLIVDNIDTYENPSKLKEFEQNSSILRKRSNENNDPALAYSISSLDDKTIIYSYLSDVVADKVEEIPSVLACVEDRKIYFTSDEKDNEINDLNKLNEILKETQWSGVSVRENADLHLSLISQGKFDGNSTTKYDKNYYYPSSAGKDIDIFIFDSGFNFRIPEFANKDERTLKCICNVINGIIYPSKNETYCGKPNIHGLSVSDVAGGLMHGVANKANIYGISFYDESDDEEEYPTEYPSDKPYPTDHEDDYPSYYEDDYPTESPTDLIYDEEQYKEHFMFISSVLAALKYIDDNMLRSNKAVFNFSFVYYLEHFSKNDQYIIDYWKDYIDHMSNRGAVFVASAGNNSRDVELDSYPCDFDNVICVGAIDNAGIYTLEEINKEIDDLRELIYEQNTTEGKEEFEKKKSELIDKYYNEKERLYEIYGKEDIKPGIYRVASFSNYGKKVDIYAPGYAEYECIDDDGRYQKDLTHGTSFSSPIVAGVAATIMSEHPEIKFDSKKMLEHLIEMGEKNIIEGILEGNPNVFINNGKRRIYQGNEETKLNDEKTRDFYDEVETDGFIIDE
eukprot:jgi/Orpsp1_1/1181592/evm.model.c7180000077854.1